MNCMIIDDDTLSRRIIEEFIQKTDGLELISSSGDPVEGINILKKHDEIHLIFLDIEMPEMSGIDFLNTLKNPPQIIIVSSKGKYAVDSYEYDVTDYLLKPVDYGRFYRAVSKAFKRFEQMTAEQIGKNEIFIKKDSALVRLKYDDILWVEAMENYVVINSYDQKFTIHFTMKSIIQQLPADRFKRVHRSYIVNVGNIDRIEDNYVIIKGRKSTKSIPIGKAYKEKFLKEINLIGK